ncbi:MAG: sodium:solute symporter family protein [Planctomycetota bacterium]
MPLAAITTLLTDPYVLAILLYLLALVGVGIYKTKSVKTSEDFMVAGRSLPWYILVGTLLATWIGSGSLFSGAGLGYRNGLAGLWSSAGAWLGIVLVFFIARRVRNFGKVTVPDIFEARYGTSAAVLATITTVIAYMTIVSYQFKGGGRVLSIVTEGAISVEAGIVITAVFAVTYTVLAGMISVVYTDVINGILMTFGILIALGYMLVQVGGMDVVIASAEAAGKWSLFAHWGAESDSGASAPIIAISFFVPTMLLLLGDANMYQRIFSARDGGSARKAILFWVIGVIVLESAISLLGLTGSVAAEQGLIPDLAGVGKAETEVVIPTLALSAVPVALGMLLVATMMAVIVSTADSFLLIPATNLTRDVYQRFFDRSASERRVVFVSRLMVLVLGFAAFQLVDQFPTVLEAAYTAYLIYGASITPALLAAFLWKRATLTGAVASILSGAGVTLLWKYGIDTQGWHPLLQEVTFPAATLSVLALVVGSLLTPAPGREVWGAFFDEQGEGDSATGEAV